MADSSGRPVALGSGFILKKNYIVSNYHVIEGAGSGFVKRIGDKAKYQIGGIAAMDEFRDLVILRVDGIVSDGVALSQRHAVEVGDTIFAIGNPRGLEGTFSQGIISSLRDINGFQLLQITAPISPGSSGGPIADENGEVVGVAVATFKGGQNLNFAIPVNYLNQLVSSIGDVVPLGQNATRAKGTTFMESLQAGKSVEGLTAGSFLWDGIFPDETLGSEGKFTFSLKNNLDSAIQAPVVLLLFHDNSGEIVDLNVVSYNGVIPPGLAKRVSGTVDPSTKRLTTPISKSNEFMYSDKPSGRVEFRTLGFSFESD